MNEKREVSIRPGSPLAAKASSYGAMKLRIELEVLRNGVAEIEIMDGSAGGGGGTQFFMLRAVEPCVRVLLKGLWFC